MIPSGGGAEILDDEIRAKICPNKAFNTQEWIETIKTAHKLGMKTNASELYGHIENYKTKTTAFIHT